MPNYWNHTPPGDGMMEFYSWFRRLDAPTVTQFFNKMAVYADLGYQDRMAVSGTTVNAWFNLTYLDGGLDSDTPTIYLTFAVGNVNNQGNSILREAFIVKPDRYDGETFQAMTVRWLCAAYSKLLEFNDEFDRPFQFDLACPVSIDGEIPEGPQPGPLIPAFGTTLIKWEPPTSPFKPWYALGGVYNLDSFDDDYQLFGGGAMLYGPISTSPVFPEQAVAFAVNFTYRDFEEQVLIDVSGFEVSLTQTSITINGETHSLEIPLERYDPLALVYSSESGNQFLMINGQTIELMTYPAVPESLTFIARNGTIRRLRVFSEISVEDAANLSVQWMATGRDGNVPEWESGPVIV